MRLKQAICKKTKKKAETNFLVFEDFASLEKMKTKLKQIIKEMVLFSDKKFSSLQFLCFMNDDEDIVLAFNDIQIT